MSKATQSSSIPDDIARLSFEEAMGELEAIVGELEAGQGDLDASIAQYTRGTLLKMHCERKLEDARLKVEKMIIKDGEVVGAEPFAGEE